MSKSSSIAKFALIGALVLVIAGAGVYLVVNRVLRGPGIAALSKVVPDDAVGFVAVRGLPGLMLDFLGPNLSSNSNDDVGEAIAALKSELDIDATSPTVFQDTGVDPTQAFGASMHIVKGDEVLGALYVPAAGGDALSLHVRRWMEDQGMEVDSDTVDGTTVYVASSRSEEIAWATVGDWTILAASEVQAQPRRFVEDRIRGTEKVIADSPWSKSLAPLAGGSDWQALVAVNPDLPRDLLDELLDEMDADALGDEVRGWLADLEGGGMTLTLKPDLVRLKGLIVAEDDNDLDLAGLSGDSKDRLVGRVPGPALGSARLAIPLEAALQRFTTEDEVEREYRDMLRSIRKEVGVDLESDVIPFVQSPISAALFASEKDQKIPLGLALWAPLAKDHKLDRALLDLGRALEDQGATLDKDTVDGTEWTRADTSDVTLSWGIARKHLVFIVGRRLSDDVTRGIAEGTGSFVDSIGDGSVKTALQGGPATALWVDFAEVTRSELGDVIKEDRDFQDVWPLIDAIGDVLYTADSTATNMSFEVTLHGKTTDAFKAVLFDDGRTSKRKLRAMRAEGPSNLNGIRTAEKAYHAEWDFFTSAGWTPARLSGKKSTDFRGGGYYSFDMLGWVADGKVRCRYKATARNTRASATDDMTLRAECDVDGDGVPAVFVASRAENARMITPNDVY